MDEFALCCDQYKACSRIPNEVGVQLQEDDMVSTLLIVLFALALLHVLRTGVYQINWGIDPGRALTLLIAILLVMAFAIGFVDI